MGYLVTTTRSCIVWLLIWVIYLFVPVTPVKAEAWEQQLASYRLDRGHLVAQNLDIGLMGSGIKTHPIETNVRVHQYTWDVVRYIFPQAMLKEIGFLVFYTDGYSGSHGLLTTDPETKKFVLGIDIRDILRRRHDGKIVISETELAQTLTHELFHSLSLSKSQIVHKHNWSAQKDKAHGVAHQIRSCPVGCQRRSKNPPLAGVKMYQFDGVGQSSLSAFSGAAVGCGAGRG